MMTTNSFKKLWESLTWWRQKTREEAVKENSTQIVMGIWDKEVPTQKDKPSPHSYLMKTELHNMLKKQWPKSKGYVISNVLNTNSMEPWIDSNSLLVLSKLDDTRKQKQPLTKGDICVYKVTWGTGYIVHRIIDEDRPRKKYMFKGDNNFHADGWINDDQIEYRVIGIFYAMQENSGD